MIEEVINEPCEFDSSIEQQTITDIGWLPLVSYRIEYRTPSVRVPSSISTSPPAQRAKGGKKIFFENQVFSQIYTLTCLMMMFKYFLLGTSLIYFVTLSLQRWQIE